jgi:WD40 repeat protein
MGEDVDCPKASRRPTLHSVDRRRRQDDPPMERQSNSLKSSYLNPQTGACLQQLRGHEGGINSLTIDEETKTLYSASDDKTLRAWDISVSIFFCCK